ncbi:MAG: LysR family transcriptional regulator [Gammaproteobacteria bacterium]|nr:MAG: LysR family transcriptional regulator [Gammaproteobacteria bacterium]
MDKLTSMAVFTRVVEKGSFAAVTEEFRVSATMVAKHVVRLEQHLGARLLDRTTRQHHLTEIGRLYYDRCKDVLAGVEAAERVTEDFRSTPRGTLKVTAPITYGTYELVPAIADYLAKFPEVKLELSLTDRIVDLVDEGIEIAIRSGKIEGANLVARPVRPHPMVVVASPAYLQNHGTPKTPQDLISHNCLGFAPWGQHPQWRFHKEGKTEVVNVQGTFTTNNGQALKVAALSSLGVILQSRLLLAEEINSEGLQILLPDWSLPTRQVHIVRTQDNRPTQKVRSFVDFMMDRLS